MRAAAKRWGDTSLAWMPLEYGLLAKERDSEEEIETIVGKLVGGPFTSGNAVNYVLNDQFHPLLRQTIQETREFHVLWIHDFRGLNSLREEDRVAWTQVARGYIDAMTAAIGALDRGERPDLPVFVVSAAADVREFRVEPNAVQVTVNGGADVVKALDDKEIEVLVNLTDIESARDLRKRVRVLLPPGVTLVRVVPAEVNVVVPPPKKKK